MMKRDAPAATIDAYLACVPEQQRRTLEKLRKTIRSAAPDAVETISYMIPAFKLNGMLVGFGAFKKHNSFFVMSSKLMAGELAADLEGYDTSKGGIRFPIDKPLPAALVRKIVKLRIGENFALRKKK
jgi:uncharacterized protein YdhG (YjbR/CyaY superfamily)